MSGGRVDAATYAPPPGLADVVECFWRGSWDLTGQAPHETRLLSDPSVHLVLEAGTSRIVGVWTRLWRNTLSDRGLVRAVKLRPGAVQAFLPVLAHELTNRRVPLADVLDPGDLERVVVGSDVDRAAFAELAAWLAAHRRPGDPAVARAVALAERARRDTRITRADALAEAGRLSLRALQRLFREHVGGSPKWVIRRARLQEAALRVERGDAPNLADLAIELGYADQAHLARDFRASVGKTLRQFEREVWTS